MYAVLSCYGQNLYLGLMKKRLLLVDFSHNLSSTSLLHSICTVCWYFNQVQKAHFLWFVYSHLLSDSCFIDIHFFTKTHITNNFYFPFSEAFIEVYYFNNISNIAFSHFSLVDSILQCLYFYDQYCSFRGMLFSTQFATSECVNKWRTAL